MSHGIPWGIGFWVPRLVLARATAFPEDDDRLLVGNFRAIFNSCLKPHKIGKRKTSETQRTSFHKATTVHSEVAPELRATDAVCSFTLAH